MKALIVEDIIATSNLIKSRIKAVHPAMLILDQAFELEKAYQLITKNTYDLVFLDIQMPKGTTFDLLKKLASKAEIDFEIIFITGQKESEFIMNAIKFSAIDYLYKPLEDSALRLAIDKAKQKIEKRKYNSQIELLLELIDPTVLQSKNRIAIHLSKGNIKFFNIEDIAYLSADGVVTKLVMMDNIEHTATKNLGYYKSFLIAQFDFQPISHSTLVNMNQVESYAHSNLTVSLKNGTLLKASRRGGKEFKAKLEESSIVSIGFFSKIKQLLKIKTESAKHSPD